MEIKTMKNIANWLPLAILLPIIIAVALSIIYWVFVLLPKYIREQRAIREGKLAARKAERERVAKIRQAEIEARKAEFVVVPEEPPKMKGVLFYDYDGGRGGPDGFLAHYQKWCVEIEGKKYHVCCDPIGTPGHPTDGPRRDISVSPCDNSCVQLIGIPNNVWKKAERLIEESSRPHTTGMGLM
jgi:hypothetical protein